MLVKNPQANAIIEQVHQVIGNMLRTFKLTDYEFNSDDHWNDLLAGVAWVVHSSFHRILQATPGQLVFGQDMLLNRKFIVNWEDIWK